MEPVFQRLGDVTIQRLEKPKPPPENNENEKEKESEDDSNSEDFSPEEAQTGTKRNLEIPSSSNKKPKYNPSDDLVIPKKLPDDNILNNSFSENELSEYETESEIDSDGELLPPHSDELIKDDDKSNTEIAEADLASNDLLDNLAQADLTPDPPVADGNSADTEDYDFDIKEKLKEMGEISFETVKKGEPKPKKIEADVENEVVVTPARKPGTLNKWPKIFCCWSFNHCNNGCY